MAPRPFSQDGAVGAQSGSTPAAPSASSSSSYVNPAAVGLAGANPFQQGGNGLSTPSGFNPAAVGLAGATPFGVDSPSLPTPSAGPSSVGSGSSGMQRSAGGTSAQAVGLAFADGGAIEDDGSASDGSASGGGDTNGSPQQDAISKALSTVDGVLAYGRKLHGLGGGDNEGAIPGATDGTQVADAGYQNGRMPAVPGNQSNSGVKPIQPMPGPLPPTSNPFGKRTSASADQSAGDDQASNDKGAIDTEEEAA